MDPRRSSMVKSKERMRKRIDEEKEEEEAKTKKKPSYPPLSPTAEEKTKMLCVILKKEGFECVQPVRPDTG